MSLFSKLLIRKVPRERGVLTRDSRWNINCFFSLPFCMEISIVVGCLVSVFPRIGQRGAQIYVFTNLR